MSLGEGRPRFGKTKKGIGNVLAASSALFAGPTTRGGPQLVDFKKKIQKTKKERNQKTKKKQKKRF